VSFNVFLIRTRCHSNNDSGLRVWQGPIRVWRVQGY